MYRRPPPAFSAAPVIVRRVPFATTLPRPGGYWRNNSGARRFVPYPRLPNMPTFRTEDSNSTPTNSAAVAPATLAPVDAPNPEVQPGNPLPPAGQVTMPENNSAPPATQAPEVPPANPDEPVAPSAPNSNENPANVPAPITPPAAPVSDTAPPR